MRRLRGVLGTSLVWGLPGTLVGAIGGLLVSFFGGAPLLGSLFTGSVAVGGVFFLLGAGSALALTLAEGHRTLDELSPRRAAIWGAVSGGTLPILALFVTLGPGLVTYLADMEVLLALLAGVGSYGALGAALAASTVAVAKRAPPELGSGQVPELEGAAEPEP